MTVSWLVDALLPVLYCPSWIPWFRLVIAGVLVLVVLIVVRVYLISALS